MRSEDSRGRIRHRNRQREHQRQGFSAAHRRRRRIVRGFVALVILCVLATSCGLAVVGVRSAVQGTDSRTEESRTEEAATVPEDTVSERERGAGGRPETNQREGKKLSVAKSCDALDVLVDPSHSLPATYEPRDLVYVQGYGVWTTSADLLLRREAAEYLGVLARAAENAGEEVLVSSAYRSYGDQQEAFAHYTGIYGDWASHVSAPPGQSQHQLGTTVDFTNSEVAYELIPTFGGTSASRWLVRNAWRHGFINTYPPEDTDGTGRQAEPWEYRYVGVQRARNIQESNLGLRKFLEKNGQAPCKTS